MRRGFQPIHATMTAAGTPWRCIKVARQYRDNTPGAYGSPAAECGHKSKRLNRANRNSFLTFAHICARQKSGTFDGDESTIEVNG